MTTIQTLQPQTLSTAGQESMTATYSIKNQIILLLVILSNIIIMQVVQSCKLVHNIFMSNQDMFMRMQWNSEKVFTKYEYVSSK